MTHASPSARPASRIFALAAALLLLTSPLLLSQEVLTPTEAADLEAKAREQYAADELESAAATYIELAQRSPSGPEAARFAVLSAWISHQNGATATRDRALQLALRRDLGIRPDAAAYSGDFLQRLEVLRTETERSRSRRLAELSRQARQAVEDGRHGDAAALYRELLELDPGSLAARLQLAIAELNARDPQGALDAVEPLTRSLETLDPEDQDRALVLATLARIRLGRIESVEEVIRRLAGPSQRQLWLELAGAHQRAERWDQAITAYGRVLEIDPADRQTAIFRSQLLGQLGRWREAESFLVNLSETLPGSAAVWNQLGLTREELDDRPGAVAAYRRGAETGDSDELDREARIASLLSLVRLLRGDDALAARQRLEQATALAPDSPDVLAMQARLLSDEGRHDQALLHARRGLEAAPERIDLRNLLGNTYYLAGRGAEAAEVFEALLEDHPELETVEENLRLARALTEDATDPSASPLLDSTSSPTTPAPGRQSATSPSASPASDPSDLPVGLRLEPHVWQRTGRTVLRVEGVEPGSKGARCGLESGDLLIRIDGEAVDETGRAVSLLGGRTSGLRLDVVRDSQPLGLVCV